MVISPSYVTVYQRVSAPPMTSLGAVTGRRLALIISLEQICRGAIQFLANKTPTLLLHGVLWMCLFDHC